MPARRGTTASPLTSHLDCGARSADTDPGWRGCCGWRRRASSCRRRTAARCVRTRATGCRLSAASGGMTRASPLRARRSASGHAASDRFRSASGASRLAATRLMRRVRSERLGRRPALRATETPRVHARRHVGAPASHAASKATPVIQRPVAVAGYQDGATRTVEGSGTRSRRARFRLCGGPPAREDRGVRHPRYGHRRAADSCCPERRGVPPLLP